MDLNTRIFFKINNLAGRNWLIDALGRAGAEWVILAMVGWYITFLCVDYLRNRQAIFLFLCFLVGAIVAGWLLNLFISIFIHKPRPYVTYPGVRILLNPHPYFSGKTFPSDHTTAAFLIFFMALILNVSWSWELLPMALWVAWGRIYVGVHYPLDIIGGVTTASLIAVLFNFIILPYFFR